VRNVEQAGHQPDDDDPMRQIEIFAFGHPPHLSLMRATIIPRPADTGVDFAQILIARRAPPAKLKGS
jgi:hypothetical protein